MRAPQVPIDKPTARGKLWTGCLRPQSNRPSSARREQTGGAEESISFPQRLSEVRTDTLALQFSRGRFHDTMALLTIRGLAQDLQVALLQLQATDPNSPARRAEALAVCQAVNGCLMRIKGFVNAEGSPSTRGLVDSLHRLVAQLVTQPEGKTAQLSANWPALLEQVEQAINELNNAIPPVI